MESNTKEEAKDHQYWRIIQLSASGQRRSETTWDTLWFEDNPDYSHRTQLPQEKRKSIISN